MKTQITLIILVDLTHFPWSFPPLSRLVHKPHSTALSGVIYLFAGVQSYFLIFCISGLVCIRHWSQGFFHLRWMVLIHCIFRRQPCILVSNSTIHQVLSSSTALFFQQSDVMEKLLQKGLCVNYDQLWDSKQVYKSAAVQAMD